MVLNYFRLLTEWREEVEMNLNIQIKKNGFYEIQNTFESVGNAESIH